MSGEYRRIQVYFPVYETELYQAIEALAKTQGVSMSHVARQGLREWLIKDSVLGEVQEARIEDEAMAYIRAKEPCRHRVWAKSNKVNCRALGTLGDVSRCVECEHYEPR